MQNNETHCEKIPAPRSSGLVIVVVLYILLSIILAGALRTC